MGRQEAPQNENCRIVGFWSKSPRPAGGLLSENPYAEREAPSVSCSVADQCPSRRRQTLRPSGAGLIQLLVRTRFSVKFQSCEAAP